ncbi:MAG TPA: TIGR02281 family clan AA aspartic protease [Rhizobiales bacterium]|nr:TIGR02281 family clan AA aspartic protease [Hyphomicrobiales bacterium]
MFYVLMGLIVTAAAVLMFNHEAGEVFGLPIEQVAAVTVLSSWLIYLAAGRFRSLGSMAQSLKQLAVWVLIGFGLVLAYSFKDDAQMLVGRVAGELVPGMGIQSNSGSVTFPRSGNGHFMVLAKVNGREVPMLVDTGATSVVLSYEDAQAAGLNPEGLQFSTPVSTANGRTKAARLMLNSVDVGGIHRGRVPAMVSQPGALRESLLGMSYLEKLGSWSVSNDRLTLQP